MTKAKVGSVEPDRCLGTPLWGEANVLGEEKTMKAAPAAPTPTAWQG
jgi:hypothetical protein